MNHRDIDWDGLRERVAAARAAETAPDETPDQPETELDVRDLGARVHGKPYQGDPLATITDRMFRH